MGLSNEILNIGLGFSMEFGEKWLNPINDRLIEVFPELTHEELENYNSICKKVNNIANKYVCDNPIAINGEFQAVSFDKFSDFMLDKFKWISNNNLSRLYSQSCYYALK